MLRHAAISSRDVACRQDPNTQSWSSIGLRLARAAQRRRAGGHRSVLKQDAAVGSCRPSPRSSRRISNRCWLPEYPCREFGMESCTASCCERLGCVPTCRQRQKDWEIRAEIAATAAATVLLMRERSYAAPSFCADVDLRSAAVRNGSADETAVGPTCRFAKPVAGTRVEPVQKNSSRPRCSASISSTASQNHTATCRPFLLQTCCSCVVRHSSTPIRGRATASWEGCGEMGEGLEGRKSHDTPPTPPCTRRCTRCWPASLPRR